MKKVFLKSEQGFTLVELMVVVAIIGILSAVAVPNFKKYQAKSKQSEAKIQLAAVYSSEVAANADYDTYGTCLTLLGYETPPRGYYLIGFATGFDASAKFTNCNAAATPLITPTAQLAVVTANKPTAAAGLPASTASQTGFTAAASASIASGAANALDQWTMTEAKALVNSQLGY